MTRIEDYALLADTETAALVGKDGSIDWWTLPRFDSGAVFASLLGGPDNGHWTIAPAGEVRRVERCYRPGTLILETTFTTDEGQVTLVDAMIPRDGRPNLVRIVQGDRGRVPMRMVLRFRFDYGSIVPWVTRLGGVLVAVAGPDRLVLSTPVATHGEDRSTVARFSVGEGDRIPFEMAWSPSHEPWEDPPNPEAALAGAERWWCDWTEKGTYRGSWAVEAQASLTVLKGLTYAPTGGLVAAATTSLPETIGGVRNWDYRFCWLRDATFSLIALLNGGYTDEAHAWRDWLLRAAAGEPEELQIMYGLAGERRLAEMELPWLAGYEGSAPVRIGNAAVDQFQLDVYGEVMDALHQGRLAGMSGREDAWQLELALLDFLEGNWQEPDEGIWEIRGPRQHFTHSKVMAWVAVDRAIDAVEGFGHDGPVDRWRAVRDEIRAEVLAQGVDDRGVFVQRYGSSDLDASLLTVPLVGFLPASDPRVVNTVEAIQRELTQDGFVRRYLPDPAVEGVPGDEGAFLLCTFWLVDNLHLIGRTDEATALYERLLGLRNDVGLLSEQVDPATGRMLGNFPQAFSHVALVDSAMNLCKETIGPAERRTDRAPRS